MPRDESVRSILVLGSGPIVIGQACEFDYSGTQAVKALAAEGLRVILVNSNPATIMTDPDLANAGPGSLRTYIEPLTEAVCARIIEREKPDALLPTVGGQTAINLAIELAEAGVLDRHGVRLLGADVGALRLAEDRLSFKTAMEEIGLEVPRSGLAGSLEAALELAAELGYPLVVRPSFTLAGMGSGIARDREELIQVVTRGLELSPVRQCLIEESVLGWKEYELEVMRDRHDQAVVVCSIENFDPMGVHTGDSITVAPAMTLSDREYQELRDQAFRVIRRVGVATGGSNIQFAVHPVTRRILVIEMNPRVSRSSALASKATGFPIAKIAARLAIGYSLDEIANDITRKTPACFEPALDYVVVKIPRWNFEKFPGASNHLGTQMRSVGEIMAIGRTFKEALMKGLRSLEMDTSEGTDSTRRRIEALEDAELKEVLSEPSPDRIAAIREALWRRLARERAPKGPVSADLAPNGSEGVESASRHEGSAGTAPSEGTRDSRAVSSDAGPGLSVEEIAAATGIERWFLLQIAEIVAFEQGLDGRDLRELSGEQLLEAKRLGISDRRLARLFCTGEEEVRATREVLEIQPVFHRIDTCAGEFESFTPYLYSTYELQCEADAKAGRKVLILGGGPIRIGQGIEFDYCACHAAFALRRAGIEAILQNCNPETVSTDYDTADRLYFEPVTLEDVIHVVRTEHPLGVIVQFGGQTPLNLAHGLERAGVKILGTSVESIDLAEDRERFGGLLVRLGIPRPEMAVASNPEEALQAARGIGYPVIVRPSYVLGGRAMQVIYDDVKLREYLGAAFRVSSTRPLFLDRFLEDAFEVDVDALSDGNEVLIAGIQQHIEEAGIHSGDSACVLPPFKVPPNHQQTMRIYTARLARALRVVGLLNVQFAIKDDVVYILEANPRASRTVPWVSKASGLPLAQLATRVILGERMSSLVPSEWLEPDEADAPESDETPAGAIGARSRANLPDSSGATSGGILPAGRIFVKMPVFSSNRFPDVDTLLGPEMRSTGEVLGIGPTFGHAFAKAAAGAGLRLPLEGTAFLTVHDLDKEELLPLARDLSSLGFKLTATRGTAIFLNQRGCPTELVYKVNEGHPNAADRIASGEIRLVINTPLGRDSFYDETAIRRAALAHGVPCITTLSGSRAVIDAIRTLREGTWDVEALQDLQPARDLGARAESGSARR